MTDQSVAADAAAGSTAVSVSHGTRAHDFSQNVHYLRGIAALSVMLFHAGYYFERQHKIDIYKATFPSELGVYGVAIFFAISGYLMASLIVKQTPVDFLWRRIARIYPMFLIATVVTLALRPEGLANYQLASIVLAPIGPSTYPLRVEWTLISEVFFYVALFGAALALAAKRLTLLAAVWLLAITANVLYGWSTPKIGQATIFSVLLMPANAGFAAGLLIPRLLAFNPPTTVLAAGFALAFVATTYVLPGYMHRLIAGVGCAALVAAALRSTPTVHNVVHVPMTKLGDWSYAMYLVHVPVFLIVFSRISLEPTHALFALWILAVLLVSALAGELDLLISRTLRGFGEAQKWTAGIVLAFLALYISVATYRVL